MSTNSNLYAVTSADFDSLVLSASEQRLVLVDFWAAWCGPCKSIAPMLEQLAEQLAGKLAVAKIDSDAEPALGARYGIRSLPTLLLFKKGAVVDQLIGAHPIQALAAFVAKHLERDSDRWRREAADKRIAGDLADAVALLEAALASDPENFKIHPELAEVLIDVDALERAAAVLELLPSRAVSDASKRQLARLKFAQLVVNSPSLVELQREIESHGASSVLRYRLAIRQVIAGDYAAALAGLLEIIRTDRAFEDGTARKAILDIFTLLPDGDALVREYRTLLARALN
ncbi:MAG: thioredoxin [Gammaproteobacteria bacterium]|nr:thioredoxin [Gammaproteobacteria bacterium]